MTSASAEQLAILATAAKAENDHALVVKLCASIRLRFPGSISAAEAAFTLGSINVHRFKNYSAAASWFRAYLKEAPSGPLAREAAGRLVECLHLAGQRASACAAANFYLSAFPEGPHARYARRVRLWCSSQGNCPEGGGCGRRGEAPGRGDSGRRE